MSQTQSGIILQNDRYSAKASFNGLTFLAKDKAKITPANGRTFNVQGINLQTSLGIEAISKIDLEDAGLMHLTTNQGEIRNIPINYFYLKDQMAAKRTEFTPGEIIEAVSDVVLDMRILAQNDLYIELNKTNITNISNPIMNNIAPGLGKDIAQIMLDKTSSVVMNLQSSGDLIALVSKQRTRCTFKLGGHNSAIAIKPNVSIGNPIKVGKGVRLDVQGIDVTVKIGPFPINGSIEKVYIGPYKVTITVLGREVDIKYDQEDMPMEGPKKLSCI